MQIVSKTFTLKDGRDVLLRSPKAEDAAALLAYLKKVSEETDFMIRYPEEVIMTEMDERQFLENISASSTDFMISAVYADKIIGNIGVNVIGDKVKLKHRVAFGIAVLKDYWGLGIGRELLIEAIETAKKNSMEQMELGVFENNPAARSLYGQLDFRETGKIPRAFRLKDGTYIDEIQMVRFLQEGTADVETIEQKEKHGTVKEEK